MQFPFILRQTVTNHKTLKFTTVIVKFDVFSSLKNTVIDSVVEYFFWIIYLGNKINCIKLIKLNEFNW